MSSAPAVLEAYWVEPGRLMAGEYPYSLQEDVARAKLEWLLDQGITYILDLTESGEYKLLPYNKTIGEIAVPRGIEIMHRRMPIADMSAPSLEQMAEIQEALNQALESGNVVYVHCYGGVGRTGTVIGCYLVDHGYSGEAALNRIRILRGGIAKEWQPSPETDDQRRIVLSWHSKPGSFSSERSA